MPRFGSVLIVLAGIAACAPAAETARVRSSYDAFSRRLMAIYADQDSDGRIDQWTYFDGNLVLRGEKDVDGDGRIDRWEYFDRNGRLDRIGSSSANDGVEDMWTWPAGAGTEGRIARSRARDRSLDRFEFFVNGVLVRAEEDTNADGRIDRWDRYEGSVMREAAFDTTFVTGRPNRRALYGASGAFERVEADDEFDGTFVTVRGAKPPR